MRSTQEQQKRIKAEAWFKTLVNSQSRYAPLAYRMKKYGFNYCQIMDHFAGEGLK